MAAKALIAARVTAETKERFAAVAKYQGLSESAFLKRLVEAALIAAVAVRAPAIEPVGPVTPSGRISVRLHSDDLLLLRERAKARALAASTYMSFLLRAHFRSVSPLPTAEFDALRKSLIAVSAIGRNLNQIARALNSGEQRTGPGVAELQALVHALTRLRDDFRKLLEANRKSWSTRDEETSH